MALAAADLLRPWFPATISDRHSGTHDNSDNIVPASIIIHSRIAQERIIAPPDQGDAVQHCAESPPGVSRAHYSCRKPWRSGPPAGTAVAPLVLRCTRTAGGPPDHEDHSNVWHNPLRRPAIHARCPPLTSDGAVQTC